MNRKQRRALKKDKSADVSQKISLFDKLPDKCLTCNKQYDKKSKEMAMTWSVVVREESETVRLYCPECWKMATDAIETMRKEIENVSIANIDQSTTKNS